MAKIKVRVELEDELWLLLEKYAKLKGLTLEEVFQEILEKSLKKEALIV